MAALYLFAMLGLAPVGGVVAGWIAGISGTTFALAVLGTIGLAGSVVGTIVLRIRGSRADAYSP
jgi:hypothetical protein